jgi:hypothetical protein
MISIRRLISLVACSSPLLVAGCLTDPDAEGPLGVPPMQEQEDPGRTYGNGYTPWELATTTPDLNTLAQDSLSHVDPAWVTDPAHHGTLAEIVRCALPHGTSITVGTATYDGEFGVAEGWLEAPATAADRRWVSACVGALLNAFGTHVPVQLRGAAIDPPSPAANPSGVLYAIDEIRLFGQVFPTDPLTPPQIFACGERRLLDACGGGWSDYLTQRICGQMGNTCNVTVVGACEDVCEGEGSEQTCSPWTGGPTYHEVIAVSLLPTSAALMYRDAVGDPLCDFDVEPTAECADGTIEDIFVDQGYHTIAFGCAEGVASADRASLCGAGLVPCDHAFLEAWDSSWPPAFDYWVHDGEMITAPWTPDSYGNTPGGTTAGTACCVP